MRIGLIVEYEGTGFHGSQLQTNVRTVQGELEKALQTVFEKEIRVHLASRTDTGVHATGQVAAFDVDTGLTEDTIRRALNYYLPEDVRAGAVARVANRFDPRRDAEARQYVYSLTDVAVQSPMRRRIETPVKTRLDEHAMDRAGRILEGVHDFASFAGSATPEGASTVRRMDRISAERMGDRVALTFRGNAFLHQQVRRMAAELVDIGHFKMTKTELKARLEAAKRGLAGRIMPARGLCLVDIAYSDAGPKGLPLVNGNQR